MNFSRSLLCTTSLAAVFSLAAIPTAHAGKILDGIKSKGVVTCGVHTGRPGFALTDSAGNWSGLDVDYCRALAAGVLGDANKVKFVPTSGQTRITALQSGEIDVLARNTTWTFNRDAALGLAWVGINFYDGQAFLVRKKPGLNSVKQLAGATICVESGSTTEKNLADYFKANKMAYKAVVFDQEEASQQALGSGRCQAYTNDYGALAVLKAQVLKDPDNYVILPEIISKEPLGPAVRRGDDEWFAIARWTLYAMVEAEELGISSANIDNLKASSAEPAIKRFVGSGDDMGKFLGLDKEWSYRIVKTVGNYGESFERNLGQGSKFKLPRGRMNLWTKGGLMMSPPLR
ncbi:amino acid ABC transporter substrate-binding protein [Curvibacter sp. CHRR-16]|uniref:amino acid ABC transporter substrate-binding protein n=1 Tax=Curvibacter sp. CHRR-16 TaxID=2835872 RepID=UPI001BD98D6B|nr:amino acid ABC transporter substrate-binding protein [Curvibacter sp. CHRR-16]MBT0570684.1 amino acid ABC transporter substrate-binding protein [Curvibacter sp. CHRR-16]